MIWLLDDDTDELFLVTRALRKLRPDLAVAVFADGRELLAKFAVEAPAQAPTLVVSDLNMPGLDGPDCFAELVSLCRRMRRDVPTLVLTSSAPPLDLEAHVKVVGHPTQFISKPSLPQELAQALLGLL